MEDQCVKVEELYRTNNLFILKKMPVISKTGMMKSDGGQMSENVEDYKEI